MKRPAIAKHALAFGGLKANRKASGYEKRSGGIAQDISLSDPPE